MLSPREKDVFSPLSDGRKKLITPGKDLLGFLLSNYTVDSASQ